MGYLIGYYHQCYLINLVTPAFVLTTMLGGFILGGVIVGAIGSIAALRKFLIV